MGTAFQEAGDVIAGQLQAGSRQQQPSALSRPRLYTGPLRFSHGPDQRKGSTHHGARTGGFTAAVGHGRQLIANVLGHFLATAPQVAQRPRNVHRAIEWDRTEGERCLQEPILRHGRNPSARKASAAARAMSGWFMA